MNKKYKDNVIPFPDKTKAIEKALKDSREAVEFMTQESVDTAVYMLELIEDSLEINKDSLFHNMDFRDSNTREARDMHAIVNLLNAMFMRFLGIPHDLQHQLDTAFVKAKAMNEESDFDDEEYEIEFIPDFDLDGDDNDNS
jgi:uncharacterized protein YfkK (UPF0435 family)